MSVDRLFVGRERELARLNECAQRAQAREPAVVLIHGAPGTGKSALVKQWLSIGSDWPGTVLRATADDLESDLAFGLIGQLIGRADRHSPEQSPALTVEGLSPGASPVAVGGQLLQLLDDLQDTGPVLLIIEDAQWADRSSLQALGFVLRRLEVDRILTIVTVRSPVPESIRKLEGHARQLELALGGLDPEPIAELVRRVTGGPATGRMAARLYDHTGGNPLYLRALLSEAPKGSLQGFPSSGISRTWPVPVSLAAAVRRQLEMLPSQSRALVEAAAILNRTTPLGQVGQMAEIANPSTALGPALEANLLRWWPNQPAAPIAITHALQRDAVIEALAPATRRTLHRLASALVPAAEAWFHKVAAADGPDDTLSCQLEAAATNYLDRGATERAATLLLWAADLASTRAEQERLLLMAAQRLLQATQVASVRDLLPRIKTCRPSLLRSLALGAYAILCGDTERAESELTPAFEEALNTSTHQRTAALLGAHLTFAHLINAHWESLTTTCQKVLDLHQPDPAIKYIITGNLATGRARADGPRAALKELERLTALPRAAQADASQSWLLVIRGDNRVMSGMPSAGCEDLVQALNLNQDDLGQGIEEGAECYLAVGRYWLGRWDEALVHAERAIATATALERRYAYAYVYGFAAWVPASRGQTHRAQELLHAAAQHVLPYTRDVPILGWTIDAQARADWPTMLRFVDDALRLPSSCVRKREVLWKPLQAEAFLRNGHFERAEAALRELATMNDRYPALSLARAWLSGELAQARGDFQAARLHYENGLTLPATPDDNVMHRAFLHHAYALLLAETDEPKEAGTHLAHAEDTFTSLAAVPYIERTRAALEVLTPRHPVPALHTREDQLTDRESEIAILAAQGMTNMEIAHDLYVSSKTVEYHLSHIYAKLNLTSRRQLRSLAPFRAMAANN